MSFTYKEKRHVWGLQDKENGYLIGGPLGLFDTRKEARTVRKYMRGQSQHSVVKVYITYEIHNQSGGKG